MARTERTTKEVVEDTRTHLSELVDAHKELAKAELRAEVQAQVRAIAPIGVAAFLGLYVLAFFLVTGAKALELVVAEWLAWLIVSLLLLLVIVVAALVTRSRMNALKRREGPTGGGKVAADVQNTVAWAKTQIGDRSNDG